jgi:(R)-2-hydroxyglutarate---pyruvate transhydrogenase
MESDEPIINNGILSQSPAQFASMWALREGITEAVSKEGKAYKYDISIPLPKFQEVVDVTREHLRLKGLLHEKAVKHVIAYGHIGDGALHSIQPSLCVPLMATGNLHLNIVADAYTPEITNALEPFVYEVVGKDRHLISILSWVLTPNTFF